MISPHPDRVATASSTLGRVASLAPFAIARAEEPLQEEQEILEHAWGYGVAETTRRLCTVSLQTGWRACEIAKWHILG